ncbi:hypothetical protein [Nocardia farcinica]|uniref:hypothetical protein n=1 Tax=Nocardia farcinica TaxID=37329 RepID=UPI0018942DCC|nr:hypothetical protein [Nocardia farcinica]MBF6231390.1 hypothetical protein [Nocardia farcinica]
MSATESSTTPTARPAIEGESPVVWPDPSPLTGWWERVMRGGPVVDRTPARRDAA